ncbi:MAG TPA: hypothetical protein PLR02_12520 [Rhodocyclaceae bacterium]|jgi:hypothetical protein|nr:hypothetical protein [Rhodocyclaceae bacterium]
MAVTPDTSMIWTANGPIQIGTFDIANGRPDSGYLVDVYRVGCGNSALTTNIARTTKDLQESCSGQRLTLAQLETGKTMSVSLSMYQFSGRTLAAALFGAAVVVESGTVTAEQLPELAPGDYFNLRHPKASAIVIEDSTAVTPLVYVAGTHYTVEDADHARCRLIAHPAAHVEPLRVDYAYGGYVNIAAFGAASVERGIIFNGVNQDGKKGRVIIPRIALAMDGDFSWLTNEEATLKLSGAGLYVPELVSDGSYGGFARVSLFD